MTQQEFLNRYHYNPTTDKLGAGGFGSVFKAYDTVYDREVAIKIAPVIDGKENLSLMKEVELANKFPAHPNIVNYESCFRITGMEGAKDIGILQYYPEGSLANIIKKGNLNPTQQKQLIHGILNGLDFLHTHNVMHRDMKPGNILIAKRRDEYVPKIADFGLSRQVDSFENSSFVNSFAGGSAYYAAPEQLAGEKVRANVDLWSFGVILYELLTGDRPFTATATKSETEDARQEIYGKIKRGDIPNKIGNVAEPYQTMIKACLIPDRTKRVSDVQDLRNIMAGQAANDFNFERTTVEDKEEVEKVSSEQKSTPTASSATSVDKIKQESKSKKTALTNKKEKSKLPMVFGGIGLLAAIGIGMFLMLRGGGEKMNEQDLWISTLTKKDTTSYISYLTAFPQGKFANEATTQLDSLRLIFSNARQAEVASWSKAETTNSIASFQNYLNTYPNGKNVAIAQEKISDLKAGQSAEEAEALRKAEEKEDKVWERCERKKEIKVYQDYLQEYPKGRYVGKADKAISDIKIEQERQSQAAESAKKERLAKEAQIEQNRKDREAKIEKERLAQEAELEPNANLATIKISSSLERKFKRDAARLALRIDSEKEDLRYLNINIPRENVEKIYQALTWVYQQTEQGRNIVKCNIHTFPNPTIDYFIVIFDKNVDWAAPLRDGIEETDSEEFNYLLDEFNLVISKHVNWNEDQDAVEIRSKQPLNMSALANEFYNIEGVHEVDLGIPSMKGNDIQIKRQSGGWELTYILRFGKSEQKHLWKFQVSDNGTIRFLSEFGDEIPDWVKC